jgi:hypothetical protein
MRKEIAAFFGLVRWKLRPATDLRIRPNSATSTASNAGKGRIEADCLPMRLMFAAALLLSFPAAALADNNPAFDPGAICASIYQPVCANKAGETRTFPNACLAKRAGFTPVGRGGCGEARELPRFGDKQHAPIRGERRG